MKQPAGGPPQGSSKRARYASDANLAIENTHAPGASPGQTGPTVHPKSRGVPATAQQAPSENDPPDGVDPFQSWFPSNIPAGLIPTHLQAKPVTTQPAWKGMSPSPPPLTEKPGPLSGAPKKAEPAKPLNKFRSAWRKPEEAQQWLEKLTHPGQAKLPPERQASLGVYWVPEEVHKRIVGYMSPRAAVNWALACNFNYAMVDSMRPLSRLPTFLQLLPSTKSAPSQDMVKLLLDWFNPEKKSELSDGLYTPLAQRLCQAMILALRGAVPNDTWAGTIALADKAVAALGKHKWTALNDLLEEYVRQHQSVDMDRDAQRLALSRIVPKLELHHKAEHATDALVDQIWLKLARFLPLITDTTWNLFPDGALAELTDDALLHVRLLEQDEIEEWPERSVEQKLACARNCLSDYLGHAHIANHLLSRVGNGELKGPKGYAVGNRLNVTRHIVGLSSVLGLDKNDEAVLMPQAVALLEAEVRLLESALLPPWAADEARATNTLDGEVPPQETRNQLVASMAWRFGRLARMAVHMRVEQPEFLESLRAIAHKWPSTQLGYVVSGWLERAAAAAAIPQ